VLKKSIHTFSGQIAAPIFGNTVAPPSLTSLSLRNETDRTVLYVWEQLYEHVKTSNRHNKENNKRGSEFVDLKLLTTIEPIN